MKKDQKLSYEKEYEKDFFIDEIERVEKESTRTSLTLRYPLIASSSGLTEYIERRYDLNNTLSTWDEAVQSARTHNGRLVKIDSSSPVLFLIISFINFISVRSLSSSIFIMIERSGELGFELQYFLINFLRFLISFKATTISK